MSLRTHLSCAARRIALTLRRVVALRARLAFLSFAVPLAHAADGIDCQFRRPSSPPTTAGSSTREFDITFSPRLEEAVNRGVPLYFVVEFELARPRWYWFDEKPIQLTPDLQDQLHAVAAPVPALGRQRVRRTSRGSTR